MKWPKIVLNGRPYGITGDEYEGSIKFIQGHPAADSGCVIHAGSGQGSQASLCTPEEAQRIIVEFCVRIIRAGGYIACPQGILDRDTRRLIREQLNKGLNND